MKFVTEKMKKLSVVDIMLIVVGMYAMYMLYNCTANYKEHMEVEYHSLQPASATPPSVVPARPRKSEGTKGSGSCGAGNFVSSNLLPKSNGVIRDDGFEFAPKDLQGMNFLEATDKIGVDTVGNSLRNANRSIRDEPANPKTAVSPWMNSTIDPDLTRRAL